MFLWGVGLCVGIALYEETGLYVGVGLCGGIALCRGSVGLYEEASFCGGAGVGLCGGIALFKGVGLCKLYYAYRIEMLL